MYSFVLLQTTTFRKYLGILIIRKRFCTSMCSSVLPWNTYFRKCLWILITRKRFLTSYQYVFFFASLDDYLEKKFWDIDHMYLVSHQYVFFCAYSDYYLQKCLRTLITSKKFLTTCRNVLGH